MKNARLNWIRLPVDHVENLRDLGGYSTKIGQQTKWHAFLRSSELSHITKEGIHFLKEYGVRTVIDLRRNDEAQQFKNPLSEEDFITYHNIAFRTDSIGDVTQIKDKENFSLSEFYIDLLNQHRIVKEIFKTIYHAKDGAILFHCKVGKDRTGVLSMLLLGLAGVEKKDIISNYEVSFTNIKYVQKNHTKKIPPLEVVFRSRAEDIAMAYDYLIATFGSIQEYLLSVGIRENEIEEIKHRLIDYESFE